MALTDTAIRNIKATGKVQKITDGDGLYLHVNPKGEKFWRFRFSFNKKRNIISFGKYPHLSLAEARKRLFEARSLLANGIDPSAHKKATQVVHKTSSANCFEVIAHEWHSKQKNLWTNGHGKRILAGLEKDIFPIIGRMPIKEITAPILLQALRKIEARGALDAAHRILQHCSCILRYGIATGRLDRDVSADLKGALPPVKNKHLATITEPRAVGRLLRDIDAYHGGIITKTALRLSPYLFVRPVELRMATWDEFDFDNAEWHIPKERMKMGQAHIVPLSQQVLEILEDLRQYTGSGRFLFPSARGESRSISNAALLRALCAIGYSGEQMTVHGFRSMASTLLNAKGYNRDWIERQLAHSERNKVRAAYNHTDYLPDRKRMMQEWADYLDELRGSK
ncbi:MAG: integrase arm-type DNA-binding domain-containing protein [Deferribacteraceae bacterium]|nr:integrase arm-type DNA-binding domain-containing protein [Deferribacteraceae bacterium]